MRIIRSISWREKPSAVWASQYSSVSDTPDISQPSVQRVTATPASLYSRTELVKPNAYSFLRKAIKPKKQKRQARIMSATLT